MQLESFTVVLNVPNGATWRKFFNSLPFVPTLGEVLAYPLYEDEAGADGVDYCATATFEGGKAVAFWSNSVEALAGDGSGLDPDCEVQATKVRVVFNLNT